MERLDFGVSFAPLRLAFPDAAAHEIQAPLPPTCVMEADTAAEEGSNEPPSSEDTAAMKEQLKASLAKSQQKGGSSGSKSKTGERKDPPMYELSACRGAGSSQASTRASSVVSSPGPLLPPAQLAALQQGQGSTTGQATETSPAAPATPIVGVSAAAGSVAARTPPRAGTEEQRPAPLKLREASVDAQAEDRPRQSSQSRMSITERQKRASLHRSGLPSGRARSRNGQAGKDKKGAEKEAQKGGVKSTPARK
eukprot:TRINITY_DN15768_c0_g1_i1.p1 TRINITY_DN15768_c0_g1~~TRINITY_DN15768_c0_g1_i1.p1  ORF type:complete len:252 (-),score=56.74 TRINITY_DN15768_c0_g1_i1:454-1209(-)